MVVREVNSDTNFRELWGRPKRRKANFSERQRRYGYKPGVERPPEAITTGNRPPQFSRTPAGGAGKPRLRGRIFDRMNGINRMGKRV